MSANLSASEGSDESEVIMEPKARLYMKILAKERRLE
jgi:hypothetical protein